MINFNSLLLGILFLSWVCIANAYPAAETPVPRIVLALYDSQEEPDIQFSRIHRLAEFPLNHLGLIVQYHDIRKNLPAADKLEQIRGVISWFTSESIPDPVGYLSWAMKLMDIGKRFVVLGSLGADSAPQRPGANLSEINEFLHPLGVHSTDNWIEVTYDMNIVTKDPHMVEFEHRLGDDFPPFLWVRAITDLGHSYLTLRREGNQQTDADLVVLGPSGGYVGLGYTHFVGNKPEQIKWVINPFEFFRQALNTDAVPKPDTTTLSGRRIYYSHINGDGWRNISLIPKYLEKRATSAEVILEEILKSYSDLPITVVPVAASLDPNWLGDGDILRTARAILSLPHVEAGSHSYQQLYQHHSQTPEWPTLRQYDARRINSGHRDKNDKYILPEKEITNETEADGINDYDFPRAYAKQPLRHEQEISGSIAFINGLLPPHKRVKVHQWSANTYPSEEAIAATKTAKVRNINGGNSRFDRAFPSHAWIAPLGRQVGNHWQIYASNSSESSYTENWTQRYFGFRHLDQTLRNTETPVRLKPINVYYHMYSGERTSSLAALHSNLEFIRGQNIAPIATSRYAAMADGFFSTKIIAVDKNRWRFENRDALQTIRFDQATLKTVDFTRSEGVIGQRHYQGSLYVALDETHPAPVIALAKIEKTDQEPQANRPYLVQSRWRVFALESTKERVRFNSDGFGPGEFYWQFPQPGAYKVIATDNLGKRRRTAMRTDENGLLILKLDHDIFQPVTIKISLMVRNKT
jgi:hypothetical protein